MEFEEFFKNYIDAIKKRDKEFMRQVYSDWLKSAGVVPEEQLEHFYNAMFEELVPFVGSELQDTESYDGYTVAKVLGADGSEFFISFKKKGDSWVFFNERSGFTRFSLVYTIGYAVEGGKLRMLFNGKRSPAVSDMQGQGFMSPVNAALEPGENEITLASVDGSELDVSITINSAKPGEIADSGIGNALEWKGKVKEEVKLKLKAE